MIDIDLLKKEQIPFFVYQNTVLFNVDSFEFASMLKGNSISAIITDPPYGVKEYEIEQLNKMRENNAGVWRLPPAFDGSKRQPLPRFTDLKEKDRKNLSKFFKVFGEQAANILAPGGHLFVASNAHLAPLVIQSLTNSDLEFRTEIIRLVTTFRGGDRPKLAEKEFPMACTLPRGGYEPWGLFRKKIGDMTVSECLRQHKTGALRRINEDSPFKDVIECSRTPKNEKDIAPHPSLKPQKLMRKLVHASLPTGEGVIFEPFAGSGSTLAAAINVGCNAIGCERDKEYFEIAKEAIPKLSRLSCDGVDFRAPTIL
ncbi:DNA-methyltransferase [Gelidibacter japonicus]|uniref:DNA-methyltransferase n=1 Tax=Gelidibacter japonicus TaxID=1962232 RepID=UPI003A8CBAA8